MPTLPLPLPMAKGHFCVAGGNYTLWSSLVVTMTAGGQEAPGKVVSWPDWMDWQVLRWKPIRIEIEITSAAEQITFKIL